MKFKVEKKNIRIFFIQFFNFTKYSIDVVVAYNEFCRILYTVRIYGVYNIIIYIDNF